MRKEAGSTIPPDSDEVQILGQVLAAFQSLSPEGRIRLLQTVATFFNVGAGAPRPVPLAAPAATETAAGFSVDRSISPKEFLLEKQPLTDVERVACLAYYLTHYRDTRFFKTLDLSKLNTEAAQRKFANAAWSVENATKYGYLVPATKGNKQLSAMGEQFVDALPNREAAKAVTAMNRPRRKPRKAAAGKNRRKQRAGAKG